MTPPRRIVAGNTYLVTRRCSRGQFLLVPDKDCWQVFCYCLAAASNKYGVAVHCAVMMSNHYHLVLSDTEGNLPLFMGWFNRQLSKYVQKLREWPHEVWECNRSYNAVELLTPESIWQKILYCVCNPVRAKLVSTHKQYRRGLLVPAQSQTIKAPVHLLKHRRALPDCTLRMVTPKALEHSFLEWDERVAVAQREARGETKRFMGWSKLLSISPMTVAKQLPKSRLKPVLASTDATILRLAKQALRQFRSDYRDAYVSLCERAKNAATKLIPFPAGAWFMTRFVSQVV